ncbi:MAG TPA: hypothetical protein VFE47_05520 [Tepidisphaeraceae bacterium]|nr:hypothetical protein [Tepidisphaeraceae bacterium]
MSAIAPGTPDQNKFVFGIDHGLPHKNENRDIIPKLSEETALRIRASIHGPFPIEVVMTRFTRFILACFVVGLGGCALGCTHNNSHSNSATDSKPSSGGSPCSGKGMETYSGRNLRSLDAPAMAQFRHCLQLMTGDAPTPAQERPLEPWAVEKFSDSWIVLLAYPGYDIPDVSFIEVQLFDKNWKRIFKQQFPTGYRFFLTDLRAVRNNVMNQELVVATVNSAGPFIVIGNEKHPAFEKGDSQREYFALIGEEFALVRLEDDQGRLAANNYTWRIPMKGPPVPKRTRAEWIATLNSGNPAEELATLAWLSGSHLKSTDPRPENVNEESVDDSRIFEEVRDDPATPIALEKLADSKNAWIKEYVRLMKSAEK